uniref:Glycerol kinase 5 n=1 Tax=Cyprinus carpio TaxID=7962 RepID=A0A8C2DZX3_CYPCA
MGTQRNGFSKRETFILSVDVGTTSIRCHVYDKSASIRGSCSAKVSLLYPQPGWVEIDPEDLWKGFVTVVKGAVQDSGLQMCQMESLGISTQRATFITWDRNTGKPFHNFITWQDLRAAELVRSWNRSCTMKTVHGVMKMLHFLTRQKRFLAASLVVFTTQHVSLRLVWALNNIPQLRQAVEDDSCYFGTIDTWLLYKLTKGLVHATDYSNASATAIFDSYQMCWSGFLCSLLSIPLSILPSVQNTRYSCTLNCSGISRVLSSLCLTKQIMLFFFSLIFSHKFGTCDPSIFGVPIPVMSVMADQQAAMFGECCFDIGDVKITMGTGTFMNINTGNKPHTSIAGLYPLVGWKIGADVVYLAEGNAAGTGAAIKWAQDLELFSDVKETGAIATSVEDSDGVYFVPSFSGLQAPLNDPKACASFMGLKPSTTKRHLVRAILESIAFRNKQLFDIMLRETRIPITKIRADGGVCTNNFIMQLTADLLGRKIERPSHFDMSCLGAAFVAGLGTGYWRNQEELKKLLTTDQQFLPRRSKADWDKDGRYRGVLQSWERALQRSMHWYSQP